MAKTVLSVDEEKCWVNLRGKLGLTTYQIQNLVRDFGAGGLWPLMVRIGKELVPYQKDTFDTALLWAIDHKADDHVQPYYHPNECTKVVGSSPTTYTNWALLLLHKMYGTSAIDLPGDVVVQEHVPRCTLTDAVRDELYRRGASGRAECRLVSCQMLAFYIGAQVDWASLDGNAKVAPFRKAVDREVRAGGEDKKLQPLQVVYSEKKPKVDVAPALALVPPVVVAPVAPPTPVEPVTPVAKSVVDEIIDSIDSVPEQEPTVVVPPPVWHAPPRKDVDEFLNDLVKEPMHGDLDAEIEAKEAELRELRHRKERARIQGLRGRFIRASITAVDTDDKGNLTRITLQTSDGRYTYQTSLLPEQMDGVLA